MSYSHFIHRMTAFIAIDITIDRTITLLDPYVKNDYHLRESLPLFGLEKTYECEIEIYVTYLDTVSGSSIDLFKP